MRELLDTAAGQHLTEPEYRAEFRELFWAIGAHGFWKLEARQTFQEPGDASWEAFARGDWSGALELIEAQRSDLEAEGQRLRKLGLRSCRVRVVETPLTPYLQWELHLLNLIGMCADEVRVVTPQLAGPPEALPEVVTLGAAPTYEIRYNAAGVLEGAVRFDDAALTSTCRGTITDLFEAGEDIATFFAREVAPLPPPSVT